jgi:mannose-6-phosphate isomerase-like protein (cupin superfamily)
MMPGYLAVVKEGPAMTRMLTCFGAVLLASGLSVAVGAEEKLNVFGTEMIVKTDGSKTGGAMTVVETTVPAGSGPPRHVHSREDEMFYIVSGRFKLLHGSHEMEVGPGEVIFLPRDETHTYRNVGSEPGKLLVTITPAGFEGFFREVSERRLTPPQDMEAITALADKYGLKFTGPPLQ